MFAFDWLADPTAWAGLLTLVVLEIVLGIDNLVFIAILPTSCRPGNAITLVCWVCCWRWSCAWSCSGRCPGW